MKQAVRSFKIPAKRHPPEAEKLKAADYTKNITRKMKRTGLAGS
jgi:hypothetical protein